METSLAFNPPPEEVPAIIEDLTSPNRSLISIAVSLGITVDALALWMAHPDIQARIAAVASAAALQLRLSAAVGLSSPLRALRASLDSYVNTERSAPQPTDLASHMHAERRRAGARRGANLYLRLANFFPKISPPAPTPRTPGRPGTSTPSAATPDTSDLPEFPELPESQDPSDFRAAAHSPAAAVPAPTESRAHLSTPSAPSRSAATTPSRPADLPSRHESRPSTHPDTHPQTPSVASPFRHAASAPSPALSHRPRAP